MELAWARSSSNPLWGSELSTCNPERAALCLAKDLGAPRASLSPPIMREGLVRFRHAVYVFFLLDSGAAVVGGIQQLIRQLVDHSLFAASARIGDDPANRQRRPPVRVYFHRNLVVGATNAAGLHFQQRLAVLHGLLEQLERFVAALLLQLIHCFIEDALGCALLARPHHGVDELVDQVRPENRIGHNPALRYMTFSWHVTLSSCC